MERRNSVKNIVDNDVEWYCSICNQISKPMPHKWVDCPTHGYSPDGKFRRLIKVTTAHCVWCDTKIDQLKVRDNMATCSNCKQFVPIKFKTIKVKDRRFDK